jgi:hypothetical protein
VANFKILWLILLLVERPKHVLQSLIAAEYMICTADGVRALVGLYLNIGLQNTTSKQKGSLPTAIEATYLVTKP